MLHTKPIKGAGIVTALPYLQFPNSFPLCLLRLFRGEGRYGELHTIVLVPFLTPFSRCVHGSTSSQYYSSQYFDEQWRNVAVHDKTSLSRSWKKEGFCLIVRHATMLMMCMTCCLSERHGYNWHSAFPSNLGRESGIQVVKSLPHDLARQLKYLRLLYGINFSSALWRRWSHEPAQGWINHSSLLIHPY